MIGYFDLKLCSTTFPFRARGNPGTPKPVHRKIDRSSHNFFYFSHPHARTRFDDDDVFTTSSVLQPFESVILPAMLNTHSLPVKIQPSNLRPIAYRILSKKHGLNIQTDALTILTDTVVLKFGSEWKGATSQQFLEEIAKMWKHLGRGLFIDGDGLNQVIKEIASKEKKSAKRVDNSISLLNGELLLEKAGRTDTIIDIHEDTPEDEGGELDWENFFKVITPDNQPNFQFDKTRKQFSLIPGNDTSSLKSNLNSSTKYFNNRYHLLRDRLSRNNNFLKTSFSSISKLNNALTNKSMSYEITLIKNMLGRDGAKFILFGLISKNINGDYILEDSSDHIELNLSQAYKTEGSFYCLGMFVVVEGIYSASGGSMANDGNVISGCFHVSNIGQPPVERREISMENYGNLDFMGINKDNEGTKSSNNLPIKIDKTFRKQLVHLEKSLTNHKIIILGGDCHLDDIRVLNGLKKLFNKIETSLVDGFDDDDDNITLRKPLAIVMVGSFISQPLTGTNSSVSSMGNSELYKHNFDNLSDILSSFPSIVKTTKLILIPGPNDPWQSTYSLGGSSLNILPQKPISKLFVTRLERLLPKGNLILGWNPSRINYLSQEILFFKDNLMNKFKRNEIVFESELEAEMQNLNKQVANGELNIENIDTNQPHVSIKIKQARKLVKTLLDQGNLSPFLKDLRLVNTSLNTVLRIEPLPSSIVLLDSNFENYEVTYNGCKVVNISKLIASNNNKKLNYAECYPSTKKYEFKELYF